jgi:hypothetical protein
MRRFVEGIDRGQAAAALPPQFAPRIRVPHWGRRLAWRRKDLNASCGRAETAAV